MSVNWLPEAMPVLTIGHVARPLARLVDLRLRQAGITASQLPVLVALKNGEKLSQKELAAIAGVEQPSMAQLLSRMERDGLVRREVSPDDGRISLIALTEAAQDRLEPGRDILRALDAEVCTVLDKEEQDLLNTLLFRIAARLEEIR